jgi:protein-tyrosine-phosphatase
MHEHHKRILFLCAHRSVRSLMAANLFAARTKEPWDIWSTPVTGDPQDVDLARQALGELGIPLLISARTTEPVFGLSWDEGVILCSGLSDT